MRVTHPSATPRNRQREIKDLAGREPVCITENGLGKHTLLSDEVLERTISDAVEQDPYESRVQQALEDSREDFRAGRGYGTREDLMAAVRQKRGTDANA